MALKESFSKTAKIVLAITAVWAVASTGGCVALYAEMQANEEKWAQERTALSEEVAALKDRNSTLDRNIVALNITVAGLHESGKGLTELRAMVKAAEGKLNTTTARRRKAVVEAATARESLDEIRTALSGHKTRIAQRRAEIEAAEARLDDLRTAAKSADARIDEAQKTLVAMKTDILAREKNLKALETNLQSARTSLDEAIDRIDKARKPGS